MLAGWLAACHAAPPVCLGCRRLQDLIGGGSDDADADGEGEDGAVGPAVAAAELLSHVRAAVGACCVALLNHSANGAQKHQAASLPPLPPAATAATGGGGEGAADEEATSARLAHQAQQAATSRPGKQPRQAAAPLTTTAIRSLLLQQVTTPVADLRRRHRDAASEAELRRLGRCVLAELLLRLCISALGELACS